MGGIERFSPVNASGRDFYRPLPYESRSSWGLTELQLTVPACGLNTLRGSQQQRGR